MSLIDSKDKDQSPILEKTSEYVLRLFKEDLSKKYVFHNSRHTLDTVDACREISSHYELDEKQVEILLLAAWFHDTGYLTKYKGHEEASAMIAKDFLEKQNYPNDAIQEVIRLILSTERKTAPEDLLQEILHDSDVINIGKKNFFSRAELLRVEWEMFLNREYTDFEWEKLQLEFLLTTNFFTEYAIKSYGEGREKNIDEQRHNLKKAKDSAEKSSQKDIKTQVPRRGIETMFRATYRNHINLSSIADSKANMMITINTIIMSVIVTVIGSAFSILGANVYQHMRFVIPIGILLFSALASVVYAVVSARPNVTHLKINDELLNQNQTSILFFGNFVGIPLDDFVSKINELMRSKELLYNNMAIDLYFLGQVLQRKYGLLKISYTIFMLGLIFSVIAFVIVFIHSFEGVAQNQ